MKNERFIFMTGAFRSGSALTSRILNAHSQIGMSADKLKFFLNCYDSYRPITKINIEHLVKEVAYRLLNRFEIMIDPEVCLKELKVRPASYASLYTVLIKEMFKGEGKYILGEIEVLCWTKIPTFLEMFPNGKALMMLRDPRDVLVSFKKNTIAPVNDYLITLFNMVDAIDHFLKFQANFPGRFYGIRYEALKLNPKEEIIKVCQFLEVEFEDKMLNEENWTELDGKPWGNYQVSSFFDENDYQNPVGRWRRLIKSEDLFLCEWIVREKMKAINLPPEGNEVSQETFDRAIEMVLSSSLLKKSFKRWCETGKGVEKYPLNPKDPTTWDKSGVKNPTAFDLVET